MLPRGDLALRHDIQLLADSGVIASPVTSWPLSWPDIARQAASHSPDEAGNAHLAAALTRIQAAARAAATNGYSAAHVRFSAAERPSGLRTFADTPREEAEAQLGVSWLGNRVAMNANVIVVDDADDDQNVRLDGTYGAITIANWIAYAGWIEKWWGPGWEGSLILSNNARPVPGITIERNHSDAPGWRWLRWIGPWRATAWMGEAERSDVAVPATRLFAARVSFRPRPWLELALSRTAQWCGASRPCDLSTFGDLLLGRDNRDASLPATEEPGNQMAGYDVRLRSPWAVLPLAAYAQLIGEDEAGGLPSRFLGLFGLELWGNSRHGTWRLHAEFADTACNVLRKEQRFDCAYRSQLYPQGYTFRRRPLGHTLDGDGRMSSLGVLLVRPDGSSWALLARRIELNRDGGEPENVHPVSVLQDELKNLELQYNRAFARGEIGLGLGLDDRSGPSSGGSELRAFVQWRQGFR